MPLIENRKFLNWSGAYFVVFATIVISSVRLNFPFEGDGLRSSPIYMVFAIPAAVMVLSVMFSAVIHIIKYRRFHWFLPLVVTAFLGAYVYGYIVASNPEFADHE